MFFFFFFLLMLWDHFINPPELQLYVRTYWFVNLYILPSLVLKARHIISTVYHFFFFYLPLGLRWVCGWSWRHGRGEVQVTVMHSWLQTHVSCMCMLDIAIHYNTSESMVLQGNVLTTEWVGTTGSYLSYLVLLITVVILLRVYLLWTCAPLTVNPYCVLYSILFISFICCFL